jgi:hypothetical protein
MPRNHPIEPQKMTPITYPPGAHEAAVEPSGPRGDNPATAGPGHTGVRSGTPENAEGQINPSSSGDTSTTPGSAPKT